MSTDTTIVQREVTVGSRVGLHARPAAAVAKAAAAQPATVRIAKGPDGNPVDARSLLSIISLGAEFGDPITVSSEGDGATESVHAIAELISHDHDAQD
jgi:phosphocarrier protein HPr